LPVGPSARGPVGPLAGLAGWAKIQVSRFRIHD